MNHNSHTAKILMSDAQVIDRIFEYIDNKATHLGEQTWQEPTSHYSNDSYYAREIQVLKREAQMVCPSVAIANYGDYLAKDVLGVPIFVVRDKDGNAKAFRNACRHRGVKLASGTGRKTSFVCPYHAWTYGTDGSLNVIPHEYGFPQVKKCDKSLVPVQCLESQGVVFVTLHDDTEIEALLALPELVPEGYQLYETSHANIPANWKIVVESFLEGYHIKSTHPRSFFPVQYDNLNVIEHFGPHSRVCFPYRAVEKLRTVERSQWHADNKLTYAYHLFPNIIVTTHPGFRVVICIEPRAVNETEQTTYIVTNADIHDEQKKTLLDKAVDLANSSIEEDRAMIKGAQIGLASNANEYLEFGLFESAIVHFHKTLKNKLSEGD